MVKSTTAAGTAFELEVADYYRGLGYVVEHDTFVNGQQVDLLARLPQPDGQPYTVMIECKHHEQKRAGNADVQSIVHAYLSARDQGLVHACTIVTTQGFTNDAKREAAAARIHLLTRGDLTTLSQRTPWSYALALSREYEILRERVPYFLPGQGRLYGTDTVIPNVAQYLYARIAERTAGLTLLFAGPGTGKTTQLLKLGDRLSHDFLAGLPVPVPFYIPLERFTRHREARYFDHFIIEYLRAQYRMPEVSWVDIATWLSQRDAVLLLDGFDEIAQLETEVSVLNEFAHIAQILGPATCAIISCRTALAGSFKDPLATQFIQHLKEEGHPTPRIAALDLLSASDVMTYLDHANAPTSVLDGSIARAVLRRPLFLKLAIDTLDVKTRSTARIESEAELLARCTGQLFKRPNLRHAPITREQWRAFLEECAFHMFLEERKTIEPSRLTSMLQQHFQLHGEDVTGLQRVAFDARVRTVLDFDLATEGLRWTHAVFRDYFAAAAIALRLVQPQPQDRDVHDRLLTSDVVDFTRYHLQGLLRQWKDLCDFQRPRRRPREISVENSWQWISPGLSIVSDLASSTPRARLAYFARGFWISSQPLSHGDVAKLKQDWRQGDRRAYGELQKLPPNTPLTNITHEDAQLLCAQLGGRLPSEAEWERAATWVDGSYPRAEHIPRATPNNDDYPPLLTGMPGNPWGVSNAAGCIWQWTDTFHAPSQRYVCRGPWWGSRFEEKITATKRLFPREPSHIRTGVRVVVDADSNF